MGKPIHKSPEKTVQIISMPLVVTVRYSQGPRREVIDSYNEL